MNLLKKSIGMNFFLYLGPVIQLLIFNDLINATRQDIKYDQKARKKTIFECLHSELTKTYECLKVQMEFIHTDHLETFNLSSNILDGKVGNKQ